MKQFLRQAWAKHSLGIVLAFIVSVMFIASWPLGRVLWSPEDGPYWRFWLSQTIFSLEANLLAVLCFVLLTKRFREHGSSQG